jgi:DNA helicase HerA-like ATPase
MAFCVPRNDQRVTIIGRTGSGKTVFGAWLLLLSDFEKIPRVIVDYKGDKLLGAVDRIKEIGLGEVPKHGGLYVVRPLIHDEDAMRSWLWKVWQRERVGLYFDEAFMLPDSGFGRRGALQAILTQGRSKEIPVISLVQRPALISRFVFSEAEYYAVFDLNVKQDREKVRDLAEQLSVDLIGSLPRYNSVWYDVSDNRAMRMLPAPAPDEIAERLNERLRPNRRIYK